MMKLREHREKDFLSWFQRKGFLPVHSNMEVMKVEGEGEWSSRVDELAEYSENFVDSLIVYNRNGVYTVTNASFCPYWLEICISKAVDVAGGLLTSLLSWKIMWNYISALGCSL